MSEPTGTGSFSLIRPCWGTVILITCHVGFRLRLPDLESGLSIRGEKNRLHQRLQPSVLAGQHRPPGSTGEGECTRSSKFMIYWVPQCSWRQNKFTSKWLDVTACCVKARQSCFCDRLFIKWLLHKPNLSSTRFCSFTMRERAPALGLCALATVSRN